MAGDQETEMRFDPPSELRCSRHDGKSWRCNHWRIHNQKYCEEHYLKLKGKSLKKKKKEVQSRTKIDRVTGIEFQTRQRSKRSRPQKGLKFDSFGRRLNTREVLKVSDEQVGEEVDEVSPQKKDRRTDNVSGRRNGGEDGDRVDGVGGGGPADEEVLINLKNKKGLKKRREEFESLDEDGVGRNCKKVKKSVKVGEGEDNKSVGEDRELVKELIVYKRREVKEKPKGETAEINFEGVDGKKDNHLLFDRKARFLERFRRIIQLDEGQDEENNDGSATAK